jgi:hypothetical protein
MKGDIIILEALNDISRESRGSTFYFINAHDFSTFQSQASRHDETDVAGAEDYASFPWEISLYVNKILCEPGS